MKRNILLIGIACCHSSGSAQVLLDGPLRLTGPVDERRVEGLAEPDRGDAAITVGGSLITGGYSWVDATVESDTILLSMTPAVTAYRDGLLLRFTAPMDLHGPLHIRCGQALSPLPLLRPDGLIPTIGQIRSGMICEVVHADAHFILMNAPERGCPPGFMAFTERGCMEVAPVPDMLFHDAVQRCAALGGRLCAWDEYIAGCNLLAADLQGMFQNWEWIDGSSDHTHGADQAGRDLCVSHRMMGNLHVQVANGRCCYHPR